MVFIIRISDIHKSMAIHHSIYGYPQLDFVIYIIRIIDVINSDRFMDIHNSNYGHHKFNLYG